MRILAKRLVLCAMVLLAALNFAYADDDEFAKNMHGVDEAIKQIVGDDYVGYKIVGSYVEVHFSNGQTLRIDRDLFEDTVLDPILNAKFGFTPRMKRREAQQRWSELRSRSANAPDEIWYHCAMPGAEIGINNHGLMSGQEAIDRGLMVGNVQGRTEGITIWASSYPYTEFGGESGLYAMVRVRKSVLQRYGAQFRYHSDGSGVACIDTACIENGVVVKASLPRIPRQDLESVLLMNSNGDVVREMKPLNLDLGLAPSPPRPAGCSSDGPSSTTKPEFSVELERGVRLQTRKVDLLRIGGVSQAAQKPGVVVGPASLASNRARRPTQVDLIVNGRVVRSTDSRGNWNADGPGRGGGYRAGMKVGVGVAALGLGLNYAIREGWFGESWQQHTLTSDENRAMIHEAELSRILERKATVCEQFLFWNKQYYELGLGM